MESIYRWGVFEIVFRSGEHYKDPLRDVSVRCVFTSPSGEEEVVDAFWNGKDEWRVRFMPGENGVWTYRTLCSNERDKGLHGLEGSFQVVPYEGDNPVYRHGPLRLSEDRRYLVHEDGTPFFWLADTAWNGVIKSSLDEWQEYLTFRRRQGFTVIQFVTTHWRGGPYDRMGERAYEGDRHIERLNVEFFKRIDPKFSMLNEYGFVAAPVLLWAFPDNISPGFNLSDEDALLLARYLVARYGAYIVVWILAGDGDYRGERAERWRRIGRELFQGKRRQPVTIHPAGKHWVLREFIDEAWLDIVGYQSGHGVSEEDLKWLCFGPPSRDWKLKPPRPFINLEPNYEMHLAYRTLKPITPYMVRRVAYWSLLVAPTAGVSYGTNGIWYWAEKPETPFAHPNSGVARPWWEAMRLPGAEDMSRLKRIFAELPWWSLRPDPELLAEQPGLKRVELFVAASRSPDGELAIVYTPVKQKLRLNLSRMNKPVRMVWVNPRTGDCSEEEEIVKTDTLLEPPGGGDWILILRHTNPHS